MVEDIFQGTRPAAIGNSGEPMPLLHFKDDGIAAYFTADYEKVKAILPTDKLEPIKSSKTRCLICVKAFNYTQTTIGAYGEFAVSIPTLYDKKPIEGPLGMLTAKKPIEGPWDILMALRDPAFGAYVRHCPVTTQRALKCSRSEWGYPSFIADMHFESTSKYVQCNLTSDGRKIMDLRVERKGIAKESAGPSVALLNQDGNLIRNGAMAYTVATKNIQPDHSFLRVYPGHPMANEWLSLKPAPRPFMTAFLNSHQLVQPAGTVLDSDVAPYDGYVFENEGKDGRQTVSYNGTTFELTNPSDGSILSTVIK